METIIIKRMGGEYFVMLPNMNYQDLVVLMQLTEKSLPLLSKAIRDFIETISGDKK